MNLRPYKTVEERVEEENVCVSCGGHIDLGSDAITCSATCADVLDVVQQAVSARLFELNEDY